MGHSIHTYFKPVVRFKDIEAVYRFCVERLGDYNPVFMGDFISLDPWAWILDFPDNAYEDGESPYLRLVTQGHIDIIANGSECREDIRRVCEAFGAEEWWTCDENADDLLCEMNVDEFERSLKMHSFEYELFAAGREWPADCYLIYDAANKIIMD